MTDRSALFEPRIEELVADAASDPDSLLLRIARDPRATRAYDGGAAISARSADLRLAERHLLTHYRAELAELFRQAFLEEIVRVDSSDLPVEVSVQTNASVATPRRSTITARARALAGVGIGGGPREVGAHLDRLAAGRASNVRALQRLPALSLVCRPSDEARLCLATAEAIAQRTERASSILRFVLSGAADGRTRAYALANYASTCIGTGELVTAVEMCDAAIAESPGWAVPYVSQFVALVRLGDVRRADQTRVTIELFGADVSEFVRRHSLYFARGVRPSSERLPARSATAIARWKQLDGPVTRSLLHAFS